MKVKILTLLCVITFSVQGQETIAEFDKLSSYNISGVVRLGEKGNLFWNAPHPTLTTRKMQRENGINLAYIVDGELLWQKNIKPDEELSEWACEPVCDSNHNYVYFGFFRSKFVKAPYYSVLRIDTSGEELIITEGFDNGIIPKAHFSTSDFYNIVAIEHKYGSNEQGTGDIRKISVDKLELLRISHETSEFQYISLDLPARQQLYNTEWELVGMSENSMYFSSIKIIDDESESSGVIIWETVRNLDMNGQLIEEYILKFSPNGLTLTNINGYDFPNNSDYLKVIQKDERVWFKSLYDFENDLVYHVIPTVGYKLTLFKSKIRNFNPVKIGTYSSSKLTFPTLANRYAHTRASLTSSGRLALHSLGFNPVTIIDSAVVEKIVCDNLKENLFVNRLESFPTGACERYISDQKFKKRPPALKALRHQYLFFADDSSQYFCNYDKESSSYKVLKFNK